MERIETDAEVGQKARQTHPLELCVERPLRHPVIRESVKDVGGDRFPGSQVDHVDFASVNGVSEQQHLKIRRLRIFVNAAFGEIDAAVGLDIYKKQRSAGF